MILTHVKNRTLYLIGISILFIQIQPALSQQAVGTWNVYSSYRTATAITLDSKAQSMWIATTGGIFNSDGTTILKSLNSLDGMYRSDSRTLTYDPDNHLLWIGYIDGTLQKYDISTELFTTYDDIRRNERFPSRRINDAGFFNNNLYLSTDFGIVVWDTSNEFVLESYTRLADLSGGTSIINLDFDSSSGYIVAATSSAVLLGEFGSDLIIPSNWKKINDFDGLVTSASIYNDSLYISTSEHTYSYHLLTEELNINTVLSSGFTTKSESESIFFYKTTTLTSFDGTNYSTNTISNSGQINDILPYNNTIWLATINLSLYSYSNDISLLPAGPYLNFFDGLSIDKNGILLSGSTSNPGRKASSFQQTGFYLFNGTNWESFNKETNDYLKQYDIKSIHRTKIFNSIYAMGSWGRGLIVMDAETKEIEHFNALNSDIGSVPEANTFTVISDLDFDSKGNIWGVSFLSTKSSLFMFDPITKTVTNYNKNNYMPGTYFAFTLHIDSDDRLWIGLITSNETGKGILVLEPGKSLTSSDDDEYVLLTSDIDNGFLPDEKITAITTDQKGEVWVGTARGLVRYLFPDFVIKGNTNERRAEYLRSVNNDSILYRDLSVTSLAVNSANQKWVGTSNDGLLLLDENGNRTLRYFTSTNSPLTSNTIKSVAVSPNNGYVYIATENELLTYVDIPKIAVNKMKKLTVYPNPFSYSNPKHTLAIIDGLVEKTTVRIVTTDGFLVDEIPAKSGRTSWKPSYSDNTRLSSGVYIVVAVDENGEQKGYGKLAIIN